MLGREIDFDALEANGHDLTLAAPTHAGRSCYVCENCGAFAVVSGMILEIWHHAHRDDFTCEPPRVGRQKLYAKLRALDLRDLERVAAL